MTESVMTNVPQVVIHGVNHATVDQVAAPEASPDDVIIKVEQCGICGSDLGYIAMGGLLGPGVPMRLGHELSGTVVEAGANVQHVAPGDRVVVNPVGNGKRIGNSGSEGGFTPLLLVCDAANDKQAVLKLPDALSFEQGAMVEPLSVSMHGVHQGQVAAEDRIVIFGAGPIGLGVVLVAQYYGVKDIVVVDLSGHRLEVARQLGATTFNADSGDLSAFLIEQYGSGEVMGMPMPAVDVYFEATGVGGVFQQIVDMAQTGARVVVLGVHKAPVEFDLVNLLIRELRISGSMAYPNEFPQVIDMLSSGGVDPSPLISHRFALSDFSTALATAQDQNQAIKVLVDCQR
jgi:2-desacetyl-2-hydroxyethyl bacteriochlorophyllide A dehydrogenase